MHPPIRIALILLTALTLPGCCKRSTEPLEPSEPDPSREGEETPKTAEEWEPLYASLLDGGVHCRPGTLPNPTGQCSIPGPDADPQLLEGMSGLTLDSSNTNIANIFTMMPESCDNSHWNEQWISNNVAAMKTASDYPQTLKRLGTTKRLSNATIAASCPNGVNNCAWKYASMTFGYYGLPTQGAIDALPASLPSDTTWHQTFALKTLENSTETVTGRLFRLITTTGGVETWHDDWVFFDTYKLVGDTAQTRLVKVTSTGDDPHSTQYGPHDHLKDYLNEMRNDGAYNANWDYAQVTYQWVNLPASEATTCPP